MSQPAPQFEPFLGVHHSLGERVWQLNDVDARIALAIAQQLGVPEIVGRVLAARGVGVDAAPAFLTPTLRDNLPDPASIKDMDRACARLLQAVSTGETIAIFGDYDVDGATSSALLKRYFNALGVASIVYIPDRQREGYGPNAPALKALKAEGAGVVVTVDCGTTAYEALEAAAADGIDVIVVDHHQAGAGTPPCKALVNPNRLDENASVTALAGQVAAVGLTFLLVIGLNRALRDAGWFTADRPQPNPLAWLDLVALGTVADVVPLTGVNRAFVAQGLKVMAGRTNAGIAALGDVGMLKTPPTTYHAGFVFGPRVNAGGRIGKSDLGTRLLTTDDPIEAAGIAHELDVLNAERRAIEAAVQEEAFAQVEATGASDAVIVAAGEGWHPGVIGIVASRLKDRFRRPAFVIALDGGEGKGSGRSISGVDLGAAVNAAVQAGILAGGGGHKMAAGLSIEAGNVSAFRAFLNERLGDLVGALTAEHTLRLDGAVTVTGANAALAETLEQAGPYGAGHREPTFAIPDAGVVKADLVGENHVRCILTSGGGGRLKAIAFRASEEPLGAALFSARQTGASLHLAGKIRLDRWMGRKEAQLQIEDAATP